MNTAADGTRVVGKKFWAIAASVAALLAARPAAVAAAPRVVASVLPLHSLVAGVMAGVGEPELIIRGAGSPHTYNLKPSEARLLQNAQVVFWIGEALETFLARPLAALGSRASVVEIMKAPGIALLAGRAGGAWGEDDHGGDGAAPGKKDHHGRASLDGHLWLEPANARVIARVAAQELGRVDPGNRGRYAANADTLIARIDALDAGLRATLAPVRGIPFVVFHDAYQYFEKGYALSAVGSVTLSAERTPGARRVREIREASRRLGARCIFGEPQFPPALLDTILEGSEIRRGTLDPLGAGLPAGPDAYFTLMNALGSSLAECLRQR